MGCVSLENPNTPCIRNSNPPHQPQRALYMTSWLGLCLAGYAFSFDANPLSFNLVKLAVTSNICI